MKNRFLNKKAEEILTNESLFENIKESDLSDSESGADETVLAKKIYHSIQDKNNRLDEVQKKQLGKQIIATINTYKHRKLIFRISSAAVFLLVVGLAVFIRISNQWDITKFAQVNTSVEFKGETRLILSGKKEIKIKTNESDIEYNKNGKAIKIDDTHEVNQEVRSNKLVMNTIVVPFGKRAHITLSDSTKVWLNSGTKLIYPARFAADKREVYLEGEGLFEVSHNKKRPFHVLTPNVDVKVLGTVFNVSDYKDDQITSTVLERGSVELKYKSNSILGHSKVMMIPGMMVAYNTENKTIDQHRVNTKYYTSWKDGYLYFEHEALGNILKKISRYYNVSIELKNKDLAKETFSGPLDLKNSANQVLNVISEMINMKVENSDKQIILTRR